MICSAVGYRNGMYMLIAEVKFYSLCTNSLATDRFSFGNYHCLHSTFAASHAVAVIKHYVEIYLSDPVNVSAGAGNIVKIVVAAMIVCVMLYDKNLKHSEGKDAVLKEIQRRIYDIETLECFSETIKSAYEEVYDCIEEMNDKQFEKYCKRVSKSKK